MQDAIGITKILGEFSKRYEDFDQLEKLNIELTIPIQLPPNGKKGDCKAVVLEVQKSLNELGGGSRIYHALGSWLDDQYKVVSDHCVVVFAAIPINNWFECIPLLRRLIRDEIQTKLLQECVFLRIDNQTFGDPLNLLGEKIDDFPSIDEFGGIDPACMKMMGKYEENAIQQCEIKQEIKGDKNIQISSGGDTSAAIGKDAVSATNYTVNNYVSEPSKEILQLLERFEAGIDRIQADLKETNSNTIDKFVNLEIKLAELAEQKERLEKEVNEIENAPYSLISSMDSASRRFSEFSSEFKTAESVAQIMVGLANPTGGKIYDGCCGTGQLLLEAHRFVETKQQTGVLHFYGQEINPELWKQAKVNFAIKGIDIDLGPAPDSTFHNPHHLGVSADYILMDVPFGMKLKPKLDGTSDHRWRLCGHKEISSGDIAWILHSLHQLSQSGVCVIHLSAGILFRSDKASVRLRKFLVNEKLLSGIIALKPGMHKTTGIATFVLIFEKRNVHEIKKGPRGIFMMDCTEYKGIKKQNYYAFSTEEISTIIDTYASWRNESEFYAGDLTPYCKVVSAEDVIENDYNLNPKRYFQI
jgi:type I restriction-modification system DNA methylase subunit